MSEAAATPKPNDETLVIKQLTDGVLRLTLNNPPANTLSIAMMEALSASIRSAGEDEAVRVVVIAASGGVFCAGHDLKELTAHRDDKDRGRSFYEQTMRQCSEIMIGITKLPKPTRTR